jgi:hypothetical protein
MVAQENKGQQGDQDEGGGAGEHLHIFINRRKFEAADGVRPQMTGADIAKLVEVPPENAVIRLETGSDPQEIAITETVQIKNGMHFLVTRKVVEGGHEPRAD